MKLKQQGFTLIELIVVIVVLGLLAAIALPKFMDYRRDAQIAALKSVAGSVASATQLNYSKWYVMKDKPDANASMLTVTTRLQNAGLTTVMGCLGGYGDNKTNQYTGEEYKASDMNVLLTSNKNNVVFASMDEQGDQDRHAVGLFGREAQFVIGHPSINTGKECLNDSDNASEQFTTVTCPVYMADKFNDVARGGCTLDNLCVPVKMTCLTGKPNNGKNKPMAAGKFDANDLNSLFTGQDDYKHPAHGKLPADMTEEELLEAITYSKGQIEWMEPSVEFLESEARRFEAEGADESYVLEATRYANNMGNDLHKEGLILDALNAEMAARIDAGKMKDPYAEEETSGDNTGTPEETPEA